MKQIAVLTVLIVLFSSLQAQTEKNYILEIDGDTIHTSLNESISFKTKDGKSHNITLKKKEFLEYKKGPVSFMYPSKYSITSSIVEDGVEQVILLSAVGTGILIQVYSTMNPENGIGEVLLNEITIDDKNAGYKEVRSEISKTISGPLVLKGKKTILSLDEEVNTYSIFTYGKGKKGVCILELDMGENSEDEINLLKTFWKSLKVSY